MACRRTRASTNDASTEPIACQQAPANESRSAFSLIEVVVAVGIFATGIVAVIGLFAPLAKSAGEIADAATAAGLADLLRVELRTRAERARSFETLSLLFKASGSTSFDPRSDPQALFASRDGIKLGGYDDAVWGGADDGKFFEIVLMRNKDLSPSADPGANLFIYTAAIRWPAFVPDWSKVNARHALPAGRSQQQILFLPGAVAR